jgi:uncharacterized OB-fold protein
LIPSTDCPDAPVPDLEDLDLAGYLAGAAQGELRVQECLHCGTRRWPPRDSCARCGGLESTWVPVDPSGTLYTWTVVWNTPLPGFRDHVPYAVGVIELDDGGIRILGYLDCPPASLTIGDRLLATFEEVRPGIKVPAWRAA